MAKSYKALKEEFVSGLSGGSISEINYVTAVAASAVFLWSAFNTRLNVFSPYGPAAFVIDFLLSSGAILFAITLYSSAPVLLNALLVAPGILLYLSTPARRRQRQAKPQIFQANGAKESTEPPQTAFPRKSFLTIYRGCMMIITCHAILAVDFPVFPRRFAKVENWGTSLMDVGVGSFVFSAGVIGARPVLKERLSPEKSGIAQRLFQSVKHSLPLLVLGLVRLYAVKGLDYAEHVTEYGVHWNFFFTLGFLPPFVAIFHSLFKVIPSYAILAVLLAAGYELMLESTSLKRYILLAPRVDLLSKNREGIFSFIGYLAIFLAGQATGIFVLPRDSPTVKCRKLSDEGKPKSQSIYRRYLTSAFRAYNKSPLTWNLALSSACWIGLFQFSTSPSYGLSLSVSRRLANLPYVLWIAAFNVTQMLLFHLVDLSSTYFSRSTTVQSHQKQLQNQDDPSVSRILTAFNRNGLAIFLLANLLTGAVNMGFKTLEASRLEAMLILLTYALTLAGVALGLHHYNIELKL